MKGIIGLGLCWASLVAAIASPGATKLPRVTVGGLEYVRLEDWARSNQYKLHWLTPKKELRLTGGSSTVALTVDSRKSSINGVSVWLSHAILLHNGSACVAWPDLTSTLHPVLFPSRNPAGRKITTICLDPGHGGKDPGNREGTHAEKTYTLLLARELSAQLSKAGFKVSLTRTGDTFVDLPVRPDMARRRGADLFISLHFNAASSAAAQGVEVFCLTPARASSTNARGEGAGTGAFPGNRLDARNVLLAYQMQKALVKRLGAEDRGVRRARFAVLRSAEMPAVLVEAGFMSNPTDAKKIYDAASRRQMAQAILEAVLAYQKLIGP